MKARGCGIWAATGLFTLCLPGTAGAQESLDQGKSPAQMFASDCVICHKSPQGLARGGGAFGLDSFLREHYAASRETAAAIAKYLKSMDTGPAVPGRASKRTAKSDDKAKAGEKKRPGTEDKPEAKAAGPKMSEPKLPEPKPSEILAPEPKLPPPANEAKPAESGKSEKSE